MRKALLIAAVAALAGGTVLAGCGSDDDGDTLTHDELIAQGDAICEPLDRELEQASDEFGSGPPSEDEISQFVTESLVPNIREQVAGLRELDAPEEDAEQLNQALDTAEEGLDELEQNPEQLEAGPGAQKIQEAGAQLQEIGFQECGG